MPSSSFTMKYFINHLDKFLYLQDVLQENENVTFDKKLDLKNSDHLKIMVRKLKFVGNITRTFTDSLGVFLMEIGTDKLLNTPIFYANTSISHTFLANV